MKYSKLFRRFTKNAAFNRAINLFASGSHKTCLLRNHSLILTHSPSRAAYFNVFNTTVRIVSLVYFSNLSLDNLITMRMTVEKVPVFVLQH